MGEGRKSWGLWKLGFAGELVVPGVCFGEMGWRVGVDGLVMRVSLRKPRSIPTTCK